MQTRRNLFQNYYPNSEQIPVSGKRKKYVKKTDEILFNEYCRKQLLDIQKKKKKKVAKISNNATLYQKFSEKMQQT